MFAVEQSRCLDLEAEISKLQNANQKDVNDEMIRETQLQEKDNVIRNLKAQVSKMNDTSCETYNAKDVTPLIDQNECVRVELQKVKQHYKELYDSIKITYVHSREQTSTMLNEIESLKAQLKSKVSCVTSDSIKPKVHAPGMYAIDVKPIPHPLKNNRSAHLNYINHLKESVETVREIVEEARVAKPLDNALNYACQYTKLSQELYRICVLALAQKRVNTSTEASGSKPRSNTKKNRILPAKRKKFTLGKLNCGYQWRPTGKKFAKGELCPLTKLSVKCRTCRPLVSGLRLFKTYDGESFKAQKLCGKVHRDRQFCNSDLEIAFRKHLCFVRNMDGVDLVKDAPSISFSPSSFGIQPPVIQHDVAVGPTIEDTPITQATLYPSNKTVTVEPGFAQSSSWDVSIVEPNQVTQPSDHLRKWSKYHPLDNIVGNPSRPISTRKQLASDALW
ncbi:hypothetical protein Tco_0952749 [Tanacetum coccineum]|uniref:Integrase, catalytic region, zinc finger, CCHC-type, peptidase aspartic, catalytic n=1 Tax=Tanacetum coccineum TaxID=301880 RepID=A0ABQ5E3Q1_9ASTR